MAPATGPLSHLLPPYLSWLYAEAALMAPYCSCCHCCCPLPLPPNSCHHQILLATNLVVKETTAVIRGCERESRGLGQQQAVLQQNCSGAEEHDCSPLLENRGQYLAGRDGGQSLGGTNPSCGPLVADLAFKPSGFVHNVVLWCEQSQHMLFTGKGKSK